MGESGSGRSPGRGQPSDAYTGQTAGLEALAERLSELARSLQDENDLQHTLDAIVHAAVGTVPGVEEASISSIIRRREVHTRAATGKLARTVDQAQYETGQGPCLSALRERKTVRLSDLSSDQRWPDFAARAGALGLGSMLAVQLYVEGDNLGALNLHSSHRDAFGDESEQIGLLFAAHAAVAMAGAQAREQLQTAIDSRDLIGQAKGILIERYKISHQDAFRLLVVASQTTNIRLFDVAEFLVRTGQLASRMP